MATVAELIIKAVVDAKGVRRGVNDTTRILDRFLSDAQRKAKYARINPLGDIGRGVGESAAQELVSKLTRHLRDKQNDVAEAAMGGLMNPQQYKAALHKNIAWFNSELQRGSQALANQGLLSARTARALAQQFNPLGLKAVEEFQKGWRIKGLDLSPKTMEMGNSMLNNLYANLNKGRTAAMEDRFRGVLDKEGLKRQLAELDKVFNDGLLSGIDKMARSKRMPQEMRNELVKHLRQAGLDAGKEFQAGFFEATGKLDKMSKSAMKTGRQLTTYVTLPLLGVGGAALKVGKDFEFAMNRAQGYTGASDEATAAAAKSVRAIGAVTQYTSTQVADTMVELTKAGFDLNESVSSLQPTLELAAAANMDMARASGIASTILQAYRLPVDQLGHATNVLVKAFASAKVELEGLGVSLRYVGSIAQTAGVRFEEIVAILALLGRAGHPNSMAGTMMREVIGMLHKPSEKARKRMRELGLQVQDTNGKMLPFVNIMRQLKDATLTTEDAFLLFGRRGGTAMTALLEQGHEELAAMTASLMNHGNIATRITEKMMEGMRGGLLLLKSAWEEFAIAFSSSGVGDVASKALRHLAGMFLLLAKAPPWLMKTAAVVGTLAAALGPLLVAFGLLGSALVSTIGLLKSFAATSIGALALNPFLLAGLAALAILFWRVGAAAAQSAENIQKWTRESMRLDEGQLEIANNAIQQRIDELERQKKELQAAQPDNRSEFRNSGQVLSRNALAIGKITDEIADWNEKLKIFRERIADIKSGKVERDNFLRDFMAELELAMADLDGKLAGQKSFIEELRDRINAVIGRTEVLFDRYKDHTGELEKARNLQREIEDLIKKQGGAELANLELLQEAERLRKSIQQFEVDPARRQFGEIKKRLDAAIEFRNDEWRDLHIRLMNLNLFLQNEIERQGGVKKASVEMLSLATEVQNELFGLYNRLTSARLVPSDTIALDEGSALTWAQQKIEGWMEDLLTSMGKAREDLDRNLYLLRRSFTPQGVKDELRMRVTRYFADLLDSAPTMVDMGKRMGEGALEILSPVKEAFRTFDPRYMFSPLFGSLSQISAQLLNVASPVSFFGDVFGGLANSLTVSLEPLADVFQAISNIVGNTLAPILDELALIIAELYPVIHAVLQVLVPILKALLPVIRALVPILEALFPVIQMLAIAFTYVAQVAFTLAGYFLKVSGWITEAAGTFVRAVGKMTKAVTFGLGGGGLVKTGEVMQAAGKAQRTAGDALLDSAKAMGKARDDIRDVMIGGLEAPIWELANAAKSAAASLRNIPTGYKLLNLRRFDAEDYQGTWPRGGNGAGDGRLPSASVVNNYIFEEVRIDARDKSASDMFNLFITEAKRRSLARYGTTDRWAEV